MGLIEHENEGRMVRPTPKRDFVTKQRDAEATNISRRILRGYERDGDAERLQHLVAKGAVIRLGKRTLTLQELNAQVAARKTQKRN